MKGQVLKLFVVLSVCLSIVAGCVPSPASAPVQPTATAIPPTPTSLDVVQVYQDAVARHDVDTAMALFTGEAKYTWGLYFTTSEKDLIRNWHEYAAALNLQTKVSDCAPTGPTVTCEWRFVHDCFGADGAEGVGYDMGGTIAFAVKDGEISDYVLTANPDPEYNQWEQAFFEWLGDTDSAESRSMTEAFNTLKFDRAFGEHLVKLCKQHAASATADLTAPVQAWVDALNSGDVDAALALFTDDVKFDVFEYRARNKNELRGIFDWLAGLETKYQIKECQKKEDRVVCTMPVSDACIAGYDPVDGLMSTMTFVPQQDGKISQVSGYPDGFGDYYAKWISPAMAWQRTNRAEELAKAESTSDRREAGAINARLCKEYGESLKATPTAPASTPLDVVQKYQDAVARHDVDTAMALFTDDATYGWGDYFTPSDKTMIRNWLEFAAGLNSQTKVNDCKPAGPTVTCEWRFVHDCFGAEGAIGAGYDMGGTVGFTVKDGKISEYVLTANPDPEYNQWEEAFFKWLEDSYPMDIGSVVQALHTWKFDREFGERLVKFCKEQAESLKATPRAAKAPAATGDQLRVVQAYYAALNSGDVDAALALFTDDVKFRGHWYATGKEALRDVFDWLAGTEVKHGPPDCQMQNDRVVCAFTVGDACVVASGATGGLPAQGVYLIQPDGKIREASESLGDVGWEGYNEWNHAFQNWAVLNRAEEMRGFGVSKEFAPRLIKLCKEYAESLK